MSGQRRRARGAGRNAAALVVVALAVSPVLGACTSGSPSGPSSTTAPSTAPSLSTSPSTSTSTSTSTAPSPSATADPGDTVAAASASAAAYLKDSGYEVKATTPTSVTYVGDGTVTVTFTCAGGATHDVGWVGLCSGGGKDAFRMVAPTRVVAGPTAQSVAMLREDAAYCGTEETPSWAKKLLRSSSKEFCYLKENEG